MLSVICSDNMFNSIIEELENETTMLHINLKSNLLMLIYL
jgi:hypothetical protein